MNIIVVKIVWIGVLKMSFKFGKVLLEYIGDEKRIVIPEGVEFVSSYAFVNNKSIEEVIMPSTLKRIGDEAFSECSNLKVVQFNECLKEIGDFAFSECESLKKLIFPESINFIGNNCFEYCINLETVVFKNNSNEEEENLSLGDYVLSNCESLNKVKIEKNVEDIGNSVFMSYSSIRNIQFPKGIYKVPADTFRGCSRLDSVELPDDITSIGDWAFWGCKSLHRINFPRLKHQEYNEECECVNLPLELEIIVHHAFGNSGVEVVVIPEKTFLIYNDTFDGCGCLQKVLRRSGDKLKQGWIYNFAYREELEKYLNKIGLDKHDAFEISEFIRKGKAHSERCKDKWNKIKNILEKKEATPHFIKYCESVKYLPSITKIFGESMGDYK